jgi:ribosomal protein L12E/L44/L45/RPP1/RPP2
LARATCSQLASPNLSEALAEQAVKNLLALALAIRSHPALRSAEQMDRAEAEQEGEREEEGEEGTTSNRATHDALPHFC